jgi:hypothetical protein
MNAPMDATPAEIPPEFRASVGFATHCSPRHVRTYYSRLIEYLAQELGEEFEVVKCASDAELAALDGAYKLVIFGTRESAEYMVNHCRSTRSMLVDHGPLHSNRTARCRAHFEVFSSPYLRDFYSAAELAPHVKGWSGGYFLTDHLDSLQPRKGECLVYLIHMNGWRSNSLTHEPFSGEDTIGYLLGLSQLFRTVHVSSHLNGGGNFVVMNRDELPENVVPVAHGPHFWNLINNVDAVFFEYSSVFAIALWNPEVKLFQRLPQHPCGPVTLHATAFHQIMNAATYPVLDDDLSGISRMMEDDPKREERERAKRLIYDEAISDPYAAILAAVREALATIDSAASLGKIDSEASAAVPGSDVAQLCKL